MRCYSTQGRLITVTETGIFEADLHAFMTAQQDLFAWLLTGHGIMSVGVTF
jgi:hypothetical protein